MTRFCRNEGFWGLFLMFMPVLAIITGVGVIVAVYDTFGTAWDDCLQAQHGENCLDFYLSGGRDRAFLEFENMYLYGGLYEMVSAAIHRILNESDIFKYRGLLCGMTALAASALTILLVNRHESRVIGWFAGLFLISSPQFWGQAFVNSKDIPFLAAFVLWWFCYMAWFRRGFLRNRWLALSGLSLGVVLGIRIVGIPLVAFTVCSGITGWLIKGRSEQKSWKHLLLSFPWMNHLLVLMVGWLVMVLIWPTALIRPFHNPMEAFFMFLMFPWKVLVYFQGTIEFAHALPRYAFVLEHFLAQPLWCYPLYGAGCWSLFLKWKSADPHQRLQCVFLGFWILPLFLIFIIKPFNFYNGIRQSLFLWPAYSWLAGIGLYQMYTQLVRLRNGRQWAIAIGVVVLLCNGFLLVARHPFSYTYRNPVVRLLPGGVNGFDSDYHALSYRLAAQYMDRIYLERISARDTPQSVLVVADEYGAFSYSRYAEFSSRSLFHYQLTDDQQIAHFEYVVVLRNLLKKAWIFRPFHLEDYQIEHLIQTNGQVHAIIYRRSPPVVD